MGVKRLSKSFYLGSIIGAMVVGGILAVIGTAYLAYLFVAACFGGYSTEILRTAILFILAGCIVWGFGIVILCILLYRAWQSIQDGNARTTPGKAVGFTFIPLFNLYWFFVAWYGFAQDYNRYIERYAITVPKLNESLFLAYCILNVCSIIPYVGGLAALAALVMYILMINKTIDAVNALPIALPVQTANQ
jgi:hypothetical protein